MRQRLIEMIQAFVLVSGMIFPTFVVAAQNPASVSLEEQLRAQYQLAKLDPSQKQVVEPGTVLVTQKGGVFAVAPNLAACPSKYENGNLHPPRGPCVDNAKSGSRTFPVGEKVYPTGMTIDLKQGSIALTVSSSTTFDKAVVDFQFPQGYLEKASALDVEDKIGEVLAVSSAETPAEPVPARESPASPGATPAQAGMNDEIIRMIQAKLSDSVIIAKIKSSSGAFDTSTDGLIKLKQAGASDAVLNAMMEGGVPTTTPSPGPPSAPSGNASPAACADYASCLSGGKAALNASQWDQSLTYFQRASSLEPSKPDAWAEMGKVYLAAGQYQDAEAMWDKALGLGGTLVFSVWHYAGLRHENGAFHLGAKEASFLGPAGEKIFSLAPGELSSVSAPRVIPRGWSFRMKTGGRNYNFAVVPVGVECKIPSMCNDSAGYAQEKAVAEYVKQTIPKLASGSLTKTQ